MPTSLVRACLLWAAFVSLFNLQVCFAAKFNITSAADCRPSKGVDEAKCKRMIAQCEEEFGISMKWVGKRPCKKSPGGGCRCKTDCHYRVPCRRRLCNKDDNCEWDEAANRCAPKRRDFTSGPGGQCGTVAKIYAYSTIETHPASFNASGDLSTWCKLNRASQCDAPDSCVSFWAHVPYHSYPINGPIRGNRLSDSRACTFPRAKFYVPSTEAVLREDAPGSPLSSTLLASGVAMADIWFGSYVDGNGVEVQTQNTCESWTAASTISSSLILNATKTDPFHDYNERQCQSSFLFLCLCTNVNVPADDVL